MLAPNRRALYVEALMPPLGFELRDAVATTYSADPDVILGIPIHLALAARSITNELEGSAIAILGALRRLAGRMIVFAQSGLVKVPSKPHALYALLEPLLIDVRGKTGALHAKLWVLRFENAEGEVRMRMIVPTRNLTSDRCWDAALVLDGVIAGGPKAANRPIADLLLALPDLAVNPASVTPGMKTQLGDLVQDLRRTEWEGPGDWDLVAFHVSGMSKKIPFPIEASDELLVVSPFLSVDALKMLADSTKRPRALVSRPEELAKVGQNAFGRFDDVRVLGDTAAADPEGEVDLDSRLRGLHAKLYIATTRTTTDLWIGSANATYSGLSGARNVEILVQLRTKKRGQQPIDDFLGSEGMGLLLEPFDPATEIDEPDQETTKRLEQCQEALSAAPLVLRAEGTANIWVTVLAPPSPIALPPSVVIRVWPLTMAYPMAVDGAGLRSGERVRLAEGELSMLTGLVAFELTEGTETLRFVRNLPVHDMPAAREGELLRAVIANREGFLALMLALFGDRTTTFVGETGATTGGVRWGHSTGHDGSGLLEHLVRACATDKARLAEAVALVSSLRTSTDGADLVPKGFAELLGLLSEVPS